MVELTWFNPEGQVSPTRSAIRPIVRDPFLHVGIYNAPLALPLPANRPDQIRGQQ
jgi:hypothetical protein